MLRVNSDRFIVEEEFPRIKEYTPNNNHQMKRTLVNRQRSYLQLSLLVREQILITSQIPFTTLLFEKYLLFWLMRDKGWGIQILRQLNIIKKESKLLVNNKLKDWDSCKVSFDEKVNLSKMMQRAAGKRN